MVDIFKCHTSHPIFPATEPSPLGHLRTGGSNCQFQSTFDNKKILIKTPLASILRCFPIEFASGTRLKTQVLTPRTGEEKEQIDIGPEQLSTSTQKEWNMSQARGDSMLKLIANRETLIHRASYREYSEPRYSRSSRIQAVLTGHVQVGPVTAIDVFKSARTLVIEVHVPSQQPGNSKSWMRRSRGTEQYARQFIPTETDHQHLEAASSQQSRSCGRPRAQETGGNSRVGESFAKAKGYIRWFQSASLEIDPGKSVNQKGLRIRKHLQALHEDPTTYRLVVNSTEQYDRIMF